MGLGLTPIEQLARARSDLRMGVAIALEGAGGAALVLAAETATEDRLDALRRRGPLDLAITGWRAATLKARAYDGDLARVAVPRDAGIDWVHATADPSRRSRVPDEGALRHPPRRRGRPPPRRHRALQAGPPAAGGAGPAARARGRPRRGGARRPDPPPPRRDPARHGAADGRDRGGPGAAPRLRGRARPRLPPRRRLGGALRGRDRRPRPARAGALPPAFGLLHRRHPRQPQVRLRPAAPRRARADRRPRGRACCST